MSTLIVYLSNRKFHHALDKKGSRRSLQFDATFENTLEIEGVGKMRKSAFWIHEEKPLEMSARMVYVAFSKSIQIDAHFSMSTFDTLLQFDEKGGHFIRVEIGFDSAYSEVKHTFDMDLYWDAMKNEVANADYVYLAIVPHAPPRPSKEIVLLVRNAFLLHFAGINPKSQFAMYANELAVAVCEWAIREDADQYAIGSAAGEASALLSWMQRALNPFAQKNLSKDEFSRLCSLFSIMQSRGTLQPDGELAAEFIWPWPATQLHLPPERQRQKDWPVRIDDLASICDDYLSKPWRNCPVLERTLTGAIVYHNVISQRYSEDHNNGPELLARMLDVYRLTHESPTSPNFILELMLRAANAGANWSGSATSILQHAARRDPPRWSARIPMDNFAIPF